MDSSLDVSQSVLYKLSESEGPSTSCLLGGALRGISEFGGVLGKAFNRPAKSRASAATGR